MSASDQSVVNVQDTSTMDLKILFTQIRDEIWKRDGEESRRQNAKLVGRCFKYRNTYGGGDEKSWWLYAKITGVTLRGDLEGIQFQDDGEGRLTVETKHLSHTTLQVPIEHDEWATAFAEFLCRVQDLSR
jgi:hypothetical protein